VSVDDVVRSSRQLLDKSSAADPFSTHILNQVIDAPFIADLFNRWLAAGCSQSSFKAASTTPGLKKQRLSPADASSYKGHYLKLVNAV